MISSLLLILSICFSSIFSNVGINYKKAFYAIKKKEYKSALTNLYKVLEVYPRHKKALEMLKGLRAQGLEYYETGNALMYFDQELALQYFLYAEELIDENNKLKLKKAKELIKKLSQNN